MPSPTKETTLDGSGVTSQPAEVLPSAPNGCPEGHTRMLEVNNTRIYKITKNKVNTFRQFKDGALNDSGASGTIAGWDTSNEGGTGDKTDLIGLQEHTVRELPIIHAAFVCEAQGMGRVICHIPQSASMPDSKTVLSIVQMVANGCKVFDRPKSVTGTQPYLQSPDGYRFPLKFRKGLPYMDIRPVRDDEWGNLPETWLQSDRKWDPSIFDEEVEPGWLEAPATSVKEHFAKLPHDHLGTMEFENETAATEAESDVESITPGEIELNVTMLINDELIESVLEYEVDGEYYHRELDAEDLSCEWGDWDTPTNTTWESYDVRSRRSSRTKKPVDYSDTQRRGKKKSATSQPSTVEREMPTTRGSLVEEEEFIPGPVTGYNNKAKNTAQNPPREAAPYLGKPSPRHYADYARHFGGVPEKVIAQTFKNTTQLGKLGTVKGLKLWRRLSSPNPALNVFRRNEPVATDTIYGPEPAVDNGSTAAQFFVGRISGFCSSEGLGVSDHRFPIALMNHIRRYGAMDQLISDNAKAELSERVMEILGTFAVDNRTSEPHNKNQNFAERAYRDVKRMVERILDMSGAPNSCWLLALEYACFLINHIASERLGWRTPTEWLLGSTPDITVLLCFIFYQPVYYRSFDAEDDEEILGRFVGIAETVGHSMTFKILTNEMKIISRSLVRSATEPGIFQNLRANKAAPNIAPKVPNASVKIGDKKVGIVVETVPGDDEDEPNDKEASSSSPAQQREVLSSAVGDTLKEGEQLPTFDSSDLLGRTFITNPDENQEQRRAKIFEVALSKERTADGQQPLFSFKARVGDRVHEHVMTYNRMLEWCDRDVDKDDFYRLVRILGHRKRTSARGGWQVSVEWASGQITWNDLTTTFEGDPVTVAMYAQKNKLLNTDGWKRCKRYVRNAKTLGRAINQVRLKNYRNRPKYKYGHQVPRDHDEAMRIDEKNGNDKWLQSEALEKGQIVDYETFESLGRGAPVPEGYQKIPCHMVYDVKHDGRYKSRFVAGGHRTSTPVDSTYSGVVSLQGIRLVTFLAELNDLELWGTDIGNAYLESYTSEKVAFIAGPEFGPELEGHTCIIKKALYGLKSSGKCWHDRLHDVLRDMGFFPSKAEEDIWMRDQGDHYEYIAVYVDDLMIASKDPKGIIDALTSKPNNFKLKGTGPVTFHLGCDFFRDSQGTLCFGPRKYIERMYDQYKKLFGKAPPQKCSSPLEKNDHPELDDSPLLGQEDIAKYQSLIGALQWAISLGRFDVATAVMTMSSFRVAPRQGHMERLQRICGYLYKFRAGAIRVRTGMPDYSDLAYKEYDWERSVYGKVREQIPEDAPTPKGKPVVTSTYKDANLYHDLATGRAVSGVLHFVNQTPIEWFTKKQATVETSTYGSEFAAGRVAIQQIAGLRTTLRYLGVKLEGPSYLFGDNASVATSGSIPHSRLSKRHQALSYHYVREAVASNMVRFHHIGGDMNPADILSKHWAHGAVYPNLLRPLLFYEGDTMDLLVAEDEKEGRTQSSP